MIGRSGEFDCVVVGGGAAGAATALGLLQAGWRVALVERKPRPRFPRGTPVTRVATLNAASMRLLEDLGVARAVLDRRGHAFYRMEVWDAHSTAAIRFDADDLGVPALGWTVELLALETSLWEALEANGADLRAETRWRAIDWRPDRVDLHLQGGDVLRTRLLVAADGGESPLRTRAGIAVRRTPYHASGVVATVGTRFAHEDTAWQRFDHDAIVAFLPLADGRCSIVWSQPDYAAEAVMALDDDAFARALEDAFGGRLGTIESVSPRHLFPLVGRQAQDYARGRLVLVGDAAHTIHPLAGQGLNLGFADVQALLEALPNEAGGDPAGTDALREYTRSRRLENETMLRAMEGLRWLFGSRQPVVTALRAAGVRQTDRRDLLKRFFALRALGL
ncbi:FAD-dependent oxidoreductase [Thioalkalivibrio nitratireducens]|uniref:FAD-dependent oxidoreductase n=1 Tax=Thioalkalivibrio nitratireducens TaxID=186931 RepID=UPI0005C17389|nr:FAD-dependent oxidoreductase [Thioalkalivibrio nitratireducens]